MRQSSNQAIEDVEGETLDIRKTELSALCPDNFLTPREIVGYLRAYEEEMELPEAVNDHLKICDVCSDNWNFIRMTDPMLRGFRERQVRLMVATVGDVALPLEALPKISKTAVERNTQQVAEALSRVVKTRQFTEPVVDVAKLTPSRVLQMCTRVQKIRDEQTRYWKSRGLSEVLHKVVVKMERSGKLDRATALRELMEGKDETVDLSKLDIPLLPMATFVCSLPHTSFFPKLVEKESRHRVLFHRKRFQELRHEFDVVMQHFESLPVSVV